MGVVVVEREGAVLGLNFGRPIVSNGDFVAWLCESDMLFPNYFGKDLLNMKDFSRLQAVMYIEKVIMYRKRC